jgi:Ca2+-binding RTX toxin-like protein
LALFPATGLAAPEGDATIQVDSFTLQPGQTGDGQAFCPPGTRVVGGGVTSTGAVSALVQVSGPLDQTGLTSNLTDGDVGRSWYANVHNSTSGTQNTFVSTAICSAGSDATIQVDPFTINGGQTGDGQAFCPPGTRVVGGGVTSTAAPDDYVQVSGPLDQTGLASNLSNGDVGKSWYANVFNRSPSTQNTFVSTAICAPPTSTTANDLQTCKGKKATIAARPGVLGRAFAGTSNADVIVGTSHKDKIKAGAGNDLVCAGGGKDKVKGGKGKDKLFGEGGRDTLLGQAGTDLLSGGGRNDACVGGPGKDTEKSC